MGLVRAYLGASLDGMIAGEDDDLSWLEREPPRRSGAPMPVGLDEQLSYEGFMADVGAMLMGRTTHDVVAGMDVDWPYGDLPVLVATHRPLDPAAPTVRGVTGDAAALVAAAREAADGRDVYVDGGALVRQVLEAGLLDELVLTLVPTSLGRGVGLFDGLAGPVDWDVTALATVADRMVQLRLEPHR